MAGQATEPVVGTGPTMVIGQADRGTFQPGHRPDLRPDGQHRVSVDTHRVGLRQFRQGRVIGVVVAVEEPLNGRCVEGLAPDRNPLDRFRLDDAVGAPVVDGPVEIDHRPGDRRRQEALDLALDGVDLRAPSSPSAAISSRLSRQRSSSSGGTSRPAWGTEIARGSFIAGARRRSRPGAGRRRRSAGGGRAGRAGCSPGRTNRRPAP